MRGIRSEETGLESFKFVLEKKVDFADLDSEMILNAVEHVLKNQSQEISDDRDTSKPRFKSRNANKNGND